MNSHIFKLSHITKIMTPSHPACSNIKFKLENNYDHKRIDPLLPYFLIKRNQFHYINQPKT